MAIFRFTGDQRKQVDSRFVADEREPAPFSELAF